MQNYVVYSNSNVVMRNWSSWKSGPSNELPVYATDTGLQHRKSSGQIGQFCLGTPLT